MCGLNKDGTLSSSSLKTDNPVNIRAQDRTGATTVEVVLRDKDRKPLGRKTVSVYVMEQAAAFYDVKANKKVTISLRPGVSIDTVKLNNGDTVNVRAYMGDYFWVRTYVNDTNGAYLKNCRVVQRESMNWT